MACFALVAVAGVSWWQWQAARLSGPVALSAPAGAAPDAASEVRGAAARVEPVEILADWDRRRAAAYATGDIEALRALYARGSSAGRRDVDMLGSYRERGLTVRGLRTQLLDAVATRQGPHRLVLRVTERVSGATAVGHGVRVPLPVSAARRRVVTLVRHDGAWVVSAVRQRIGG